MYIINSFDPVNANLIYERTNKYVTDDSTTKIDLNDYPLSDDMIDYLSQYKKRVTSKGASVYIMPPAVGKGAIACGYDLFEEMKTNLTEKTGIEYIGDPIEYFYDDDQVYDGYYHLINSAAEERTEKVYRDLKNMNVLN